MGKNGESSLFLWEMCYDDSSNGYERGKMQIFHLGFQLHCAFGDEKTFRERVKSCYEPFLAFLERNAQKYVEFRVSLQVSGVWIELAEKLEPELIERLEKLVRGGKVEILATPYYHSLSFFYDEAEFEAEVWLFQEKIRELFGVECRVLAHPDLMYNDRLGEWAERNGFYAVMAGASRGELGRKSTNYIYDARNCRRVKVLWRNAELSDALMLDFEGKLAGLKADEMQKQMDLLGLRGNLMNVFLDAEVFRRQRAAGVIRLLDELMNLRLKELAQPLMTATGVLTMAPAMLRKPEIAVEETTSWRRRDLSVVPEAKGAECYELVRLEDLKCRAPQWLDEPRQRRILNDLYALKAEVFRTEDEELIAEYCGWLGVEYAYAMSDDAMLRGQMLGKEYGILPKMAEADLRERMAAMREKVAERWAEKKVEVEQRRTARSSRKNERADEAAEEVTVNFLHKVATEGDAEAVPTADSNEATKTAENVVQVTVDDGEAVVGEETEDFAVPVKHEVADNLARRFLKRIVIE